MIVKVKDGETEHIFNSESVIIKTTFSDSDINTLGKVLSMGKNMLISCPKTSSVTEVVEWAQKEPEKK